MHHRVTVVVLSVYVCVYLSVCLSVTMKSATYLVYTSKTRCHRILYGVFKAFVVWFSLKMLRSRVVWRHFLVTATFLTPQRRLNGQNGQQQLPFNTKSVHV